MMKKKAKIFDYNKLFSFKILNIIVAGFIYSVAIKYFVFPTHIILTGTEGIATATSYYYESETLFTVLYLIFQSILLTFGYLKVGKRFALHSAILVISLAFFITVLPALQFADPKPENERIVLVLFGGILAGIAKALAFKNSGSVGDEDIVNAYIAQKLKKPIGMFVIVAGAISTIYGLTLEYIKFGDFSNVINTLMYTSIYIFVSAETLNIFYKKFRFSTITIITENTLKIENILKVILPERTYTKQTGIGGYSNKPMNIISLVVTQEEIQSTINSIREVDSSTFIYHNEIDGINGRFFISSIG